MRMRLTGVLALIVGCTAHTGEGPGAKSETPEGSATSRPSTGVRAADDPPSRIVDSADVLFGQRVEDPYRWLEDERAPEVQAWIAAQDEYARAHLGRLPGRAALTARFKQLLYVDSVGVPVQRGTRLFYVKQRADQNKPILYWREQKGGAEHVLLDPNGWANGTVSLGAWVPSRDGTKVVFAQHPNNADDAVLHVVDVASGTWAEDAIDGARYAYPSWTPDGRGFYYVWIPLHANLPVDELPAHQQVKFHRLGDPADRDALIYPEVKDATLGLAQDLSRDGKYLFVTVSRGWTENSIYWMRPGRDPGFQPLVVGKDATYSLTEWKGQLYILTDEGAPNQRVFKAPADHPQRSGWKELVPEDPRARIDQLSIVGGHLALSSLRNAASELRLFDLEGRPVRTVALPSIGSTTGLYGLEDRDEAFFRFSAFTTPGEVHKISVRTGADSVWAKVDLPIDASRFVTEQVWFPSRDGTNVSMFLVHARDVRPDGQVPTLLYGYGGFDISLTPDFRASIFPWLEAGGMYALANLRGGGEYGKAWHEAGQLHRKQNVFDDFAAAAEYLELSGWTKPARLAIQGGSNGGLLVGAAVVQRPDLFQAAICQVPLLDMIRYPLFGAGKTWMPEYGDPSNEADFRTLWSYSPYHHVRPGVRYPAVLMMSSDHDDRVDPMHARKFTARLQASTASGLPVWLRVERHAGHGGADRIDQTVDALTDQYAFLFRQLGVPPVPPNATPADGERAQ